MRAASTSLPCPANRGTTVRPNGPAENSIRPMRRRRLSSTAATGLPENPPQIGQAAQRGQAGCIGAGQPLRADHVRNRAVQNVQDIRHQRVFHRRIGAMRVRIRAYRHLHRKIIHSSRMAVIIHSSRRAPSWQSLPGLMSFWMQAAGCPDPKEAQAQTLTRRQSTIFSQTYMRAPSQAHRRRLC